MSPLPTFPLAGDIITQARKEAATGANPISSSIQNDSLYQRLHDINESAVAYPTKVGFLGWWFMDRDTIIQTVSKTTLAALSAAGASSLSLANASGWYSPSGDVGAGYVKNGKSTFDFFTYEARASGILTGVSNLKIGHTLGEEVQQAYLLPSDYGWARVLFKQSVYLKYFKVDNAIRRLPPHGYYSTKFLRGTTYDGLFLLFPDDVQTLEWTLQYQKKPATIVDQDSKLDLPTGPGRRHYIEKLKAFIYESEGETEDRANSEAAAEKELNDCLDMYGIEEMDGGAPGVNLSDW